MKRTTYCIMAATLLTTGMLLTTACANDDAAIDNNDAQTVTFTATLAPKGDNGGQTRAITTGTDADSKEILNVAWTAGEHIAIYYQKNDDSYATVKATVGEPNADGSAPITATLTNAKGGEAKFVYPYTLHDNAGGIKTSKFTGQKGTLADISTNFDAATATGTIDVSGGSASISGKLTMQNQVCICKLKFPFLETHNDEANYYDVRVKVKKDGTTRYFQASNVPKTSMGEVYMAILGTSDSECNFVVTGWYKTSPDDQSATQKGSYNGTYNNVTLVAGTFYRSMPVNLNINITGAIDLSKLTGDYEAQNGDILTGTLPSAYHLSIAEGATVILYGVTISDNSEPGITCNGDATIILEGDNTVNSTASERAGIQVGSYNTTLTINGTGSLTANGGNNAPGIGNGDHSVTEARGNIIIIGGTITANGGFGGAGIGSGESCSCGDITISGGTVNATGGVGVMGWLGAGIGSGQNGNCGNITISGGTVTATGYIGAAIGSADKGKYTSINIGSGITSVTAMSEDGTPIGKASNDKGSGSVTVDGVENWTGAETTHLNWSVSTVTDKYNIDHTCWTLSHK